MTTQSERQMRGADRKLQALELRRAGKTYQQIAAALGLAHASSPFRMIQDALRELVAEPAEEVRRLELLRLDAMLSGVEPRGDERWEASRVSSALKIMERRASLLGLDLQVQKHTIEATKVDPIAERLLDDPGFRKQYIASLERAGAGLPDPGGPGDAGLRRQLEAGPSSGVTNGSSAVGGGG